MRNIISAGRPPVLEGRPSVIDEPGLFGPHSMTWRVHADAAMLIGGVRALFLQTMHPLAMAGVAEHSNYRADPLNRLANTAQYIGVTTFGTAAQADEMIASVKRVHQRVVGHAPDGRPYAASDPHLASWIHYALLDSFLRSYQRYGSHRLTPAEADRYVAENTAVAERFGCDALLGSTDELRQWLQAERGELKAGDQARAATRFLLSPPLPIVARPAYGVIVSAAISLLPAWVRRSLWLPVVPLAEPLAIRPAARLLTRALTWALVLPDGTDGRSATASSA